VLHNTISNYRQVFWKIQVKIIKRFDSMKKRSSRDIHMKLHHADFKNAFLNKYKENISIYAREK
jgi:hypothetical protein